MVPQLRTTLYYWLRAALYKTFSGSMMRRIKQATGAVPEHETAAYWNDELSGRMTEPNLNGRISNELRDVTTVTLLRHCGPQPRRVLDVGCGFAHLAPALADQGLRRYVGVDLSDHVIDRANRQCAAQPTAQRCESSFHHADLREFSPADGITFDVIVFNEVLKYVDVDEAVAQLKRYRQWLAPGGVFCVNLTDDPKCHEVFRRLADHLQWVYGTVYQQRPDGPIYRLTRNRETPAYLTGVFRPWPTSTRAA